MSTPINQRPNDVFLSHSSRDKDTFVDELFTWLTRRAGYKVWFDRGLASGGISTNLDDAIDTCRGAIVVLSENSTKSQWVKSECDRLHSEWANKKGEFAIATIRIDPVEPPGLLKSYKHIDVLDGKFTAETASLLVETLNGGRDSALGRPAYLSRGWRDSEHAPAEAIANICKGSGLKLVCDFTDQPHYSADRVRDIMDSTGGLVAIVPHRGQGKTSSYILNEIEIARELGLPVILFTHSDVDRASAPALANSLIYDAGIVSLDVHQIDDMYSEPLAAFSTQWRKPKRGEHVFLGHSLEESIGDRFAMLKRMLSRVTGLPVVTGGLVGGEEAPTEIVRLIQDAELCIIDITNKVHPNLPEKIDFALNSCIEAGVALGAGRAKTLYITCGGPRRSPPFMLRTKQIWYYDDGLSLVGALRQIAYMHRRMVL
ncbi:MAG: toll/interleukin-1 receptor domain-containing protein [Hyphomicrobium sp.]